MGKRNRSESGSGAWVALCAHPNHNDNVSPYEHNGINLAVITEDTEYMA
jgi:hypothetical protein